MKSRTFALLALLLAMPLSAADSTRLVASAPSRLVLEGTSNVAGWRCSGSTLDGRMDVAAPLTRINAIIDSVEGGNFARWMSNPAAARFPEPSFQLHVPVTTLRCGNNRMERDMYRALRSADFPTIDFHFARVVGPVTLASDGNSYHAKVAGVLSLAGASRNITLDVEAQRIAPDRFRLRASLPLRMTDFRITPPTALFGAIKARNDLTVSFDLVLRAGGGAESHS